MHIVLLGAGHALHHTLLRLPEIMRRGHVVTVIAESRFWYSGMASGMLGGDYEPDDMSIDIASLVRASGATFIETQADGIDPRRQCVSLQDGRKIPYDLLAIGVGSVSTSTLPVSPGAPVCLVKPLSALVTVRHDLERRAAATGTVEVVVIGAGPSACEVAANIASLIRRHSGHPKVSLVYGDVLLPHHPPRAARLAAGWLAQSGIQLIRRHAQRITHQGVLCDGGGPPFACDLAVIAVGLRPMPFLAASGLPVDVEGALEVNDTLCSLGNRSIFAGGDCISIHDHRLPRLGVFGVRQGPIIFANLLATAEGSPLRRYRPQRRWLSIVNLARGMGLATWGGLSWRGHLAWWVKDRIDRHYIDHVRLHG